MVVFFGRLFIKRFALCYMTVVLSCLSVCNVGVFWPNGWTDQDETWHAGRPQHWPHCVRWRPAPPPLKGHSFTNFRLTSVVAKRLDGSKWLKMALGMETGLGQGHIVLDGDPTPPPPENGAQPPHNFRPLSIVAKRLDGSRCHLIRR